MLFFMLPKGLNLAIDPWLRADCRLLRRFWKDNCFRFDGTASEADGRVSTNPGERWNGLIGGAGQQTRRSSRLVAAIGGDAEILPDGVGDP